MRQLLLWLLIMGVLGCSSKEQSTAWYEQINRSSPKRVELFDGYSEQSLDFLDKYNDVELTPPISHKAAYEFLLKTDVFGTASVGFVGSPSKGSLCISSLMARGDTLEVCSSLLEHGQIPGKLYALCGLYIADQEAYEQAASQFRTDKQSVRVFSGCIMSEMKVSTIIEWIDSGSLPEAFLKVEERYNVYVEGPDGELILAPIY